ncbi:MAG: hypothetical protein P8Y37_13720 [Anaerolineales bacterium]
MITADPLSPGERLIGTPYDLHIDVDIDPPAEGVLQVSVEDSQGSSLSEPVCIAIPAGLASYGFDHAWTESISGPVSSLVWARYREFGTCPVEDTSDYDISQSYQVNWVEDTPVLELTNSDLEPIAQGGEDGLGVKSAYQTLNLWSSCWKLGIPENSPQMSGWNTQLPTQLPSISQCGEPGN